MRALRAGTQALFVLIGLGSIAIAYRTVFVSGMGWDAAFESYASLLIRPIDPATTTLQQAYDIAPVDSEFYGVLIYQVVDGLRLILFQTDEWLNFTSTETYLWVFTVNATYAVIGATALAAAVGYAMKSRFLGLYVWAFVLATPLFIGHASMNYKDMPVAAGVTMVSAGLIFGWTIARPLVSWIVTLVLVLPGSLIALGSRGGAIVLLLAVIVGSNVIWLFSRKWSAIARVATSSLLAVVVATLVILWSNPIARIDPLAWIPASIDRAGSYPWNGPIRMNGVDVISIDLPWWYVPVWLLAQLPLLTLTIIFATFIFAGWALIKPRQALPRKDLLPLVPLALQAILVPIVVVASGPVLYDGLRHVLFMIPALVALTAITIRALAGLTADSTGIKSAIPYIVAAVVTIASFFAVVRWYPYQYAFLNPVAGWDKQQRNWEVDYWGLSGREGVTALLDQGAPLVQVLPNGDSSSLFGGTRSREVVERWPDGAWQYGIYSYMRWENYLPGFCERTVEIRRDGILIGEGGLCPPPVEIIQREMRPGS